MEAGSRDDPRSYGQASIDRFIVLPVPGTSAINLSSSTSNNHHRHHRRFHRHSIVFVVTTSNAYRLMSNSPPPTFHSTVLARSASALHLAHNGDDDDSDDDEGTAFVPSSPSSPSSPVVLSPLLPLLRSRSFPAVSAVRKDRPENALPLSDRDSIFATHYTDNGSTESERDESRNGERDKLPTRRGSTSLPAGRAPKLSPPIPTESMTGLWLEQGRVERRARPPDALSPRSDSLTSTRHASNPLHPPSVDGIDDRSKHITSTSVTIIRERNTHSAKLDDVVMSHPGRAEREMDPPVHPTTSFGRANIVQPSTYRLWSVGERRHNGTAIEDGPVEKSVSASRPGVEPNARSRKTSHSLGLFKENVVSPTAERHGVPVRPQTTRDGHIHRPTDLVDERDHITDDLDDDDDDDDVVYVRQGGPARSIRFDRRGTAPSESKPSRTRSSDALPDPSPDGYARSSRVERGPIPTEHDLSGDQPLDPSGSPWPKENPGAPATKDRLGPQESSKVRWERECDGTPALAPRWHDEFQHRSTHGTTAGRGPPAGDRGHPRSFSSTSSDARPMTSPDHCPITRSRATMAPVADEAEDEEALSEKDEISSAFYYPRPSPSMDVIEEVPLPEEETAGQPHRKGNRSRTREVDSPSTDCSVPVDTPATDETGFRISPSASEMDLSSTGESEAELGEGEGDGDATPMPMPRAPAPLTRASAGRLVAVPPGAVELKPYRHQVGGHTTVFRFSRRAVCKSMSNRENEFYETVERKHPELLTFLPRFVIKFVHVPLLRILRSSRRRGNRS